VRVAHVAVVTPGRCGLYETTRELVAGLRKLGIDSRLVDPDRAKNKLHPAACEDRGALIADMEWATKADIIVSHSGYDATALESTGQPVIHMCHGRPRSTFLGEVMGGTPVYSYHYRLNSDPRVKAVVTFWPEHREYHEVMFPAKPVHVVQSSVDLDAWSPAGPGGYRFGGASGEINVVCTDAWRDDVDPFVPVNAFALWARTVKGAKLHIYGNSGNMRGWGALLRRIRDDGHLGEIKGWVGGLSNVYRAANFMITPQQIATRSIREAMACGCPVVRIPGVRLNGFAGEMNAALGVSREAVRTEAQKRFDSRETARQFERVLRSISC
jgi:glycosyltransferase involved in cell wall biosynthesis